MKLRRALTVLLAALLGRASAPAQQVTATLLLPVGADSIANPHYLNFYFGALMAARDFSQDTVDLNLNVIDIQSADFPTFGNRMALAMSDVIIGPVSAKDIQAVREYISPDKYIISPLDTKTESMCDTLPVILANTPHSRQTDDALDWILDDLQDSASTLLKVYEQDRMAGKEEYHIMNRLLDVPGALSISYKISHGVEAIDTFDVYCYGDTLTTRFIAVTDRDLFAKDVMRQAMEQNYRGKNTVFYGTGKVRSAEIEDLCAARTHMSTTFFVDYTDPGIQDFILKYRAFFGTDPDSFAFHGYDVLKYFVNMSLQFGSDWPHCLDQYSESGLQTDFSFPSDTTKVGAVNYAVKRVIYNDSDTYTVIR